MKHFWKALGIGALYFLLFLGIQTFVTLEAAVLVLIGLAREEGISLFADPELLLRVYAGAVLSKTALITLFSNLLTVFTLWLLFACRRQRLSRQVRLGKVTRSNVIASLLYGLELAPLMGLIVTLLPVSGDMADQFGAMQGQLMSGNTLIVFLAVSLLAPVSEELVFRGLIYTRLKGGMAPIWAALLSAVFFGLAHGQLLWMAVGFLAGLALCWIYETTGSLWCCILAHLGNNLTAMVPALIPGGWGYVLYIAQCTVLLVITVIYLYRTNPKPRWS